MKLKSNSLGYFSNIEKYDFSDIISPEIANCGFIICYALATCNDFEFSSLNLKAELEENGVIEEWNQTYTGMAFREYFPTVQDFLKEYQKKKFKRWTLRITYQDAKIIISGEREKTEIILFSANRVKKFLVH